MSFGRKTSARLKNKPLKKIEGSELNKMRNWDLKIYKKYHLSIDGPKSQGTRILSEMIFCVENVCLCLLLS